MSSTLSNIPNVEIDPEGVFKYILIKVRGKSELDNKFIVRGHARCHYHADILADVIEKNKAISECTFTCLGGGRIRHEPSNKSIHVYGYSQGYGRANHKHSVQILQEQYPEYDITFSNEGY